ncbi:MAG TPA: hypothetical protein VEH49_02875 [Methylomirabilota bacterium]|nr:hypothetical protein [Methylomirabilota bacterium]
MRIPIAVTAGALSAALILLALPAASFAQDNQSQDSVAEAARKAREEKKKKEKEKDQKPAKVYTDDDVSKKGGNAGSGGTQGAAPGEAPDKENATDKDKDNAQKAEVKDEAYWRAKFKEAKANLARAEKELDILERELQRLNVQYYSDPQKAMNEQLNRKEISDKTAAIEAKKKEIGVLQQNLEDLEDALRKAGGDPGWAR